MVTKPGISPAAELSDSLKRYVKERLAPFRDPRSIESIDELPKTVNGKIQRFTLRNRTR